MGSKLLFSYWQSSAWEIPFLSPEGYLGRITSSCTTGGHLAQTGMYLVTLCSLIPSSTRNPEAGCWLWSLPFDKGRKQRWVPAQLKVISILLLYCIQIFLAHKKSITWSMHLVSAKEVHACRDIARVYRLIRGLINSPLLHLLCPYFPLTFPLAVFSLLHPYVLSTDWGEKVCFYFK